MKVELKVCQNKIKSYHVMSGTSVNLAMEHTSGRHNIVLVSINTKSVKTGVWTNSCRRPESLNKHNTD